MKVESEKLKKFIEKVTYNSLISDFTMNFLPEGLQILVVTPDNIAFNKGVMSGDNFVKYEELDNFGLSDTRSFISKLNLHTGQIELKYEDNKLVLIGENEMSYDMTCDCENTDCYLGKVPEFIENLDNGFIVNSNDLLKISKAWDSLSLRKSNKPQFIQLCVKNGLLNMKVENEIGDGFEKNIKVDYKDCKSKFGSIIKTLFNTLEGDVNVSLKDNYPIKIMEKNDDMKLIYSIAPRVDDEESN